MNIWMNLLGVQPGRSGGLETYFRELLRPLSRVPGLRLTLLCTPALAGHLRPLVDCEVRTPGIPLPKRLARTSYNPDTVAQEWMDRFGSLGRATEGQVSFGYLSPGCREWTVVIACQPSGKPTYHLKKTK
jgi:hypothetical protein